MPRSLGSLKSSAMSMPSRNVVSTDRMAKAMFQMKMLMKPLRIVLSVKMRE